MLPSKRQMTAISSQDPYMEKNLSGKEKKWVLLENDANVFTDHTDEKAGSCSV